MNSDDGPDKGDDGSSERPGADPLIGRVVDGRFTLQSVLGRGGMGVVYRAQQTSLGRSVALKLMSGVPADDDEFQRRFFLEAATSAKLKHPNTITIFDYGSSLLEGDDGDARLFFIAMELLEGVTLSSLLSRGRALTPHRAVHIAQQVCRSLREAHAAGVVHRDLKPGNVMLIRQDDDDNEGDFVKVLDFGLAKSLSPSPNVQKASITKAGTFMGSPRYVAPEQVEGRPVDTRADIYSFGCILFRMLSGRVPFDGKAPVEIMLKQLHEKPPPLDVPGLPRTLSLLVAECLAKDIAKRPPSMDVVLQRLKLARAELGVAVLSDDRMSWPPSPSTVSVDGAPPLFLSGTPTVTSDPDTGATVSAPGPLPASLLSPSTPPPSPYDSGAPADDAVDVELGSLLLPLGARRGPEDSTKPTRSWAWLVPPSRSPWRAVATGMVVGVALGAALWLVRLDRAAAPEESPIDDVTVAEVQPQKEAPPLNPAELAPEARVRLRSDPAGADVLEVQDGLPRLLGTTPFTLTWDVHAQPQRRELMFRKDGHRPSKAELLPPRKGPDDIVWLDVDATLRPVTPEAP